jgi:hypothetical protein
MIILAHPTPFAREMPLLIARAYGVFASVLMENVQPGRPKEWSHRIGPGLLKRAVTYPPRSLDDSGGGQSSGLTRILVGQELA